jgi:hypothetical protein
MEDVLILHKVLDRPEHFEGVETLRLILFRKLNAKHLKSLDQAEHEAVGVLGLEVDIRVEILDEDVFDLQLLLVHLVVEVCCDVAGKVCAAESSMEVELLA